MLRHPIALLTTIALVCVTLAGCGAPPAQSNATPPIEVATDDSTSPQNTDDLRVGDPRGSSLWPVMTAFSLLVTLISLALAIQMLRWRQRLPDGQLSVVPEQVIKLAEHSADMNRQNILEERERGNELHSMIAEIREAFGVFGQTVTQKDKEIERLKSGGDKLATIEIARRFVRVARLAQSDIREDTAVGRDTSALESILLHLTEALRDAGFEPFDIEAGTDYRQANNAAKGPEVIKTDDASLDWQVVESIHPGFHIQTANGPLVIEPAVVRIYRLSQ